MSPANPAPKKAAEIAFEMATEELKDIEEIAREEAERDQGSDYWVVVALDYKKENAYVMTMSEDFIHAEGEINDHNVLDDSGIGGTDKWIKNAVPGLWKLCLRGWSYQGYDGEWDGGWDIREDAGHEPKLLVAFPDIT